MAALLPGAAMKTAQELLRNRRRARRRSGFVSLPTTPCTRPHVLAQLGATAFAR